MRKIRDYTPAKLPKIKPKKINILTKKPVRYGIDRLDIVSKENATDLRKKMKDKKIRPIPTSYGSLTIKPIDKISEKDKIHKKFDEAKKNGYKSVLRFVVPTEEIFDLLISNDILSSKYKPWYIELYEDIIFTNRRNAELVTYRLIHITYKLYTYDTFCYDRSRPEKMRYVNIDDLPAEKIANLVYINYLKQAKIKPKADVFSNFTLYLGANNFQFVTYARYSKTDKKPCLHREWRITHDVEAVEKGKNTVISGCFAVVLWVLTEA